jgi:formyltetrahydrofolate deformylase
MLEPVESPTSHPGSLRRLSPERDSSDRTAAARRVLTFAARSARGQVADVSALLGKYGAYVEEFAVFDDADDRRFFARVVFRLEGAQTAVLEELRARYAQLLAAQEDAQGGITDPGRPARVLILVSKADHCLRDLLARRRDGDLPMEVVAVVSNHPDLEPLAAREGIPFHCLPVTPGTKAEQEAALMRLIVEHDAEIVVLARYMQVLSEPMCRRLAGKVINIHHSFLPSFKGARPYAQAHARGVKLIGATAHFATSDLDEGPIIEQAVERVDHAHSAEHLLAIGRHVEALVLARALRYVLERRVFINGLRTVVIR